MKRIQSALSAVASAVKTARNYIVWGEGKRELPPPGCYPYEKSVFDEYPTVEATFYTENEYDDTRPNGSSKRGMYVGKVMVPDFSPEDTFRINTWATEGVEKFLVKDIGPEKAVVVYKIVVRKGKDVTLHSISSVGKAIKGTMGYASLTYDPFEKTRGGAVA